MYKNKSVFSLNNNKLVFLTALFLIFAVHNGFAEESSSKSRDLCCDSQIVGFNYGPFREDQDPSKKQYPTIEQLKKDMPILKHMTDFIRTYSTTGTLGKITEIAGKEGGLKVVPGAWMGSDKKANDLQIDNLILLANEHDNILFVVVGNEAIMRGEKGWPDGLQKHEIIRQIVKVKKNVSVPVTTSEPWYIWMQNPHLANVVDIIFVNVHPYWENKDVSEAVKHVLKRYNDLKEKYKDKKIIISETGWPSKGDPNAMSVPSIENQERFIREFIEMAGKEKIDFFFFSAFDEEYKIKEPNSVGPHWGFYFSDRTPKHSITSFKKESSLKSENE